MLAYMLLGIALLAALVMLVRWFVNADPKLLVAIVKWVGGTVVGLFVLFLIIRGQIGLLFWLVPLALFLFGARRLAGMGKARPTPGQSSSVETDYLRMWLDHDTGVMNGTVLNGAFTGRTLDELSLDELLTLLEECVRADPRSAQVLESYLDRGSHDDWRERMEARHRAGGEMTVDEAREVLGVDAGATESEIKAAYHRLMQQAHPDRGGSTYLAAKINRAKEILLGA